MTPATQPSAGKPSSYSGHLYLEAGFSGTTGRILEAVDFSGDPIARDVVIVAQLNRFHPHYIERGEMLCRAVNSHADLVAALKTALVIMEREQEADEMEHGVSNMHAQEIALARAAIAKATGK